ncbi:MAG TPA: hypothetical protein VF813_09710, partial [Anaerolineaceae bacterium]
PAAAPLSAAVPAAPAVQKPAAPPTVSAPVSAPRTAASAAPEPAPQAAPQPEEPAPAGEESPPAEGISLQTINQQWRQVLAVLREHKHFQTEAFLRSSRLLGIKDGVLILGLNSDFSKSKMESGDHLEATRAALQRVLGLDMPVRCVVATGKLNDKMLADLDIDNDGMVGTALRDLGGEVVDVQ